MVQEMGEASRAGSTEEPLPSERAFGGAVAASQSSNNVLNLSDSGLRKISLPSTAYTSSLKKLILDRNQIIKAENLNELSASLEQLSIASNRLVRLIGFSTLRNLKVLNLPHNSIAVIEGLRDMNHLVWLNLSNNNIKSVDGIGSNASLTYLDVSHNNLTSLSVELKNLSALKTLMLHGNLICTLSTFPDALPIALNTLSLAENEVTDLCQFSFLSCLPKLQQLSVQKNPCIEFCVNVLDYRSYILNWCLNLHMLDSAPVTNRESLKAEWLYTQGKGRKFKPGEMNSLTSYLKTHCPVPTGSNQSEVENVLQSDEDMRLSKVLNKQLQYQKQMQRRRTDHNRETGGGDVSVSDQDRSGPSNSSGALPLNSTVFDSVSDLSTVIVGLSGAVQPYAVNNVRNDESLPRKNGFFQIQKSSDHEVLALRNAQANQNILPGVRPGTLSTNREDFEEDSLVLVSESFLLPVDSPPNMHHTQSRVSTHEDSMLLNGANTNLDEVSFSEMLPGVDQLPEVSRETTGTNLPSASHSIFRVTDYITPVVKPNSGGQAVVKSKKDRQVFDRAVQGKLLVNTPSLQLLEVYHSLATAIQAAWRGYIFRRKHSDLILCLKRMTKMQKQIDTLTESVSCYKLFQNKVLQLFEQLLINRDISVTSENRPSASRVVAQSSSSSVRNNEKDPLSLSILENEFSRMSNQFGNPSGVGFSGNDTSTSSLRVMSLTDEEISMDSDDDNDNLQNETFTEASTVPNENHPAYVHNPESGNSFSPTSVKPPSQVKVKTKGSDTLLISWKPSSDNVAGTSVQEHSVSVLSYKIVLNSVPRGVVSGSKTQASVEGLDLTNQKYLVTVRTVTALGESVDSYPPVSTRWTQEANESYSAAEESTDRTTKYTLLHLGSISRTSPRKDCEVESPKSAYGNMVAQTSESFVPEFKILLRDVNIRMGETAYFNVSIQNPVTSGDLKVTWLLCDEIVDEGSNNRVIVTENNSEEFSMQVFNCILSDRGTVTCIAKNKAGSTRSMCNFDIQPCFDWNDKEVPKAGNDDSAENVRSEVLETCTLPLIVPSLNSSVAFSAQFQSQDLQTSDRNQSLSPCSCEDDNNSDENIQTEHRPIRRSEVSPREPLICQPVQYTSLANLVADETIESDGSPNEDVFSSEIAGKTFSKDENHNLEIVEKEVEDVRMPNGKLMTEKPTVNRLNETFMVKRRVLVKDDMYPNLRSQLIEDQSTKVSQVMAVAPPPHRSLSPILTSSFKGGPKKLPQSTCDLSDGNIGETNDVTICSETFTKSSRSKLADIADVTQSISVTNSNTNSATSPIYGDHNSEDTSASIESVKFAAVGEQVSNHNTAERMIKSDVQVAVDTSIKTETAPRLDFKDRIQDTTTTGCSGQLLIANGTPDLTRKLSCSLFQTCANDSPVQSVMVDVNGIRKLRPLKPRVMKRNSYFSKLCRDYPY